MSWWVIPEGFAGQLISGLSLRGPALHVYTVKQSSTKPPGAVAGPYTTQAQAQAKADALNQGSTATPGHIAVAAGEDILTGQTGTNVGNWLLRIGEVLLGLVLIAVGMARITRAVPVATKIAKTAGAGALVA
jgi:hypothetical protein